ncbi:MAG: dihydroorotase family protein [Rhodanobacter sp.]
MAAEFDVLIKNLRVARPNQNAVIVGDIAIKDGKFAEISAAIAPERAAEVVDGKQRLAFPGAVDAHMHAGIYQPLELDAVTESKAAAMGGVTSSLNYMRTGQYYLNKSGPYAEFFPEVLRLAEGKFHVDYAFHLAPMMAAHIDEIDALIAEHGVSSFKIFMFYGQHGLHGLSADQSSFLMTPPGEHYDYAHFEFIMRGVRRAMEKYPKLAKQISLSLHCETAEIMRAYTEIVQREGKLGGLPAYSASRPPHSEGLAIFIASYLAHETDCVNINLLHLSSRKALDAAMMMAATFPHINFRREVTIGHLMLDTNSPCGVLAKVNPPIRPREDVEYLWQALIDGKISWVCSDHACCKTESKVHAEHPDDIFVAKSGFGGTEYMLPALVSEGRKRGLSVNRMAELVSWNPAQRYGLNHKGDIAVGFDADLALVDDTASYTIHAAESESSQGYTPFEGMQLNARVDQTWLRGQLIYADGAVVGKARGKFMRRPD